MVHSSLSTGLVSSKHQGDPIKTNPLLTAVKHLDLAKADLSGAAELLTGSNPERRKALSTDGSNDIWEILPHMTKGTMLNLGLHTEFLRPSEEDALMTATGSVVRLWRFAVLFADFSSWKTRTGFLLIKNFLSCFTNISICLQ